jgi:cystine transport system ATP-binding protein
MSAIDVKNLVKKFHGQTVLHGIDLEVEQGEVVAIIGPSGRENDAAAQHQPA